MHGIVYAKGAEFFQTAKINSVLNIQLISVYHVSNERKHFSDLIYNLLFLSSGYTLTVMITLIHW